MSTTPDIMRIASSGQAEELADVLREKALSSLYYFTKVVLNYTGLVDHLHLPFCEEIERFEYPKRGFLLPRGHFKSTIVSKSYPLWRLAKNPELRILVVGESDEVAEKNLKDPKWHIQNNQMLQWLFPNLIPQNINSTKWTNDEILLPRSQSYDESSITCKGVGVKTTGFHYDLIIYDDIFGLEAAQSEAEAKRVISWVQLAPGLLVPPQDKSEELFIGTRWKEGTADVYGWLMENVPSIHWYIRSAVEDGKIIFPERYTEDILADIQRRQGPYIFSCQYLNLPSPPGGDEFKDEWIGEYEVGPDKQTIYPTDGTAPVQLTKLYRASMYDVSAGGENAKAENALIGLGMSFDRRIFVLDTMLRNCSIGEALEQMCQMNDRFLFFDHYYEKIGAQHVVEDIYNERAFFQGQDCPHCGKEHGHRRLRLKQFIQTTRWSKEERIRLYITDTLKAHRIYLRKGVTQMKLRLQITSFPNGKLVDGLDALANACKVLRPPLSDDQIEEMKADARAAEAPPSQRVHTEANYGGYV